MSSASSNQSVYYDALTLFLANLFSFVGAFYVGMIIGSVTAPMGEMSPLPSLLVLGSGLSTWVAFLMSVGIVMAATVALYFLTTSLLKDFSWSQDSWLSGLMVEIFRGALWLVPTAWVAMASLLPWAWPVVLAAAFAVPVVIALAHGAIGSLSSKSVRTLMMLDTVLSRGGEISLLDFRQLTVKKSDHGKLFELSLSHDRLDIAKELLNAKQFSGMDDLTYGTLHKVFASGDLPLVQQFLTKLYGFKKEEELKFNTLNTAIDSVPMDERGMSIVKHLIGEDDEKINVLKGHSPLQRAVIRGDVGCARFLLELGANPDYYDKTALTRDDRPGEFVSYGEYGGYYDAGGVSRHSSAFTPRQMTEGSEAMTQLFDELAPSAVAAVPQLADPAGQAAPPSTESDGMYPEIPRGVEASLNGDLAAAAVLS